MASQLAYPIKVQAQLDDALSHWLWLVKWLLVIPTAGVRDVGFAGMGASLLLGQRRLKVISSPAPTSISDIGTRRAS